MIGAVVPSDDIAGFLLSIGSPNQGANGARDSTGN